MPSAKTISKQNTGFPEYLDFSRLREEGLRHIQTFCGDVWTDHNLHDPGITILEALCYALLDLGYRTNLPLADLLTAGPEAEAGNKQFYSAVEILSNNPLTEIDFRKVLLDIDGVRNAWLQVADHAETDLFLNCSALENENQLQYGPTSRKVMLNGLYRVLLELEPVRPEENGSKSTTPSIDRILKQAYQSLHQYRNLAEDFLDISVLHDEQFAFCAQLEMEPDKDPEDVLVAVFENVREFLSPTIRFYTLQELLAKNKSIEEIYAGRPLLRESHGFIDTKELEALALPEELHTSDIYRVILDTPGVVAVHKMLLFNYIDGQAQTIGEEWRLKLTPGYHPVLVPELCKITFFKDGVPFAVDLREAANRYTKRLGNAQKALRKPYELDREIPRGIHRPVGDYHSIQHDFPLVYGIGEGGLPESASLPRKAQALQLKGYLLFLDQLLANYLAQLNNAWQFFHLKPSEGALQTYYSGQLHSVPDLGQLIRGATSEPEGETITGSLTRYRVGDVVVTPLDLARSTAPYPGYLFFSDPLQRNDTVRRVQTAFENEEARITAEEDDCEKYRFLITLPVDLPDGSAELTLRGKTSFDTPQEAVREGEALTFLGLETKSFRLIDRQPENEYSFEIAYQPRPYADILNALAETPAAALNRRDRFLNHLLARFAEDFTEYALLQYALDNKVKDHTKLVAVKEQFLANYPDISRNRGKGFNYTDAENLWDTNNITGLENRAAGLIGVDDWKRRTLSPFEVLDKDAASTYELLDFRDRTIFKSVALQEEAAFKNAISQLAGDVRNYQLLDCPAQSLYGFQLVQNIGTPEACVVAIHPDTYGNAATRDAKARYLAQLQQGSHCPAGMPDKTIPGKYVVFQQSGAGYYFTLITKDASNTDLFIRSAEPADEYNLSVAAWVLFLQRAQDRNNFRISPEPYGPRFMPEVTGSDGHALAVLSEVPLTEADALTALDDVFNYLQQHKPNAVLLQEPGVWTWQLRDPAGQLLLENCYPFATREQAATALHEALCQAADPDNFESVKDESGAWTFFLVDKYPDGESIRVAAPPKPWWDGPDGAKHRDKALALVVALAETESAFAGQTEPNTNALRLLMVDNEGQLLMQGMEIFPDFPSAQRGWTAFSNQAKNPLNFHFEYNDGIQVRLTDLHGQVIAEKPDLLYVTEAADQFVRDVVQAASADHLKMNTKPAGKVFTFRLLDKQKHPLMLGNRWYPSLRLAQTAWLESLFFARQPENFVPLDGPGILKIQLVNEQGAAIATSIENFTDPTSRNAALQEARNWFAGPAHAPQVLECPGDWYFHIFNSGETVLVSAETFPSPADAALALEMALQAAYHPDNYRCTTLSNCCWTYELFDQSGKKGKLLAIHPQPECEGGNCLPAVEDLAKDLAAQKLPYEIHDEPEQWHYELWWESCHEEIEPALIGLTKYATCGEAKAAFEKTSKSINAVRCVPSANGFQITLLSEKEKGVADHAMRPQVYATKEQCDCVAKDLKAYLELSWPNFRTPAPRPQSGYSFRLRKANAVVAFFATDYFTIKERDDQWAALLKTTTCDPPEYSKLDLGAEVIAGKDNLFYYRLQSGGRVWWRSERTFETREAAFQAFGQEYFTILALASVIENYRTRCQEGIACYFWLPDPASQETDPEKQNAIARTEDFSPTADLLQEFEIRLRHARTYPIFWQDSDTASTGYVYGFRLTNPADNSPIWIGARRYSSPSEAWPSFEYFLALLPFVENYFLQDDLDSGQYRIVVEEAGLNSSICTIARQDPADHKITRLEACTADETWLELDSCLVQFGQTVDLYPYYDLWQGCRHGLRLGGAAYRLAHYPAVFHHPVQREAARDALFHRLLCACILDRSCCPDPPSAGSMDQKCWWFTILAWDDCGKTYDRKAMLEQLLWDGDFGWLCFQAPGADQPCANANENRIEVETIIDLLALARAKDYYVEVQDSSVSPAKVSLGLLDRQNQLVAIGKESVAPEHWESLRDKAIDQAWEFPIVRRGEGFGFQLALEREIQLESIHTYPTAFEASQAYCRLLKLLKNKSNYIGTEPGDCGPFGIEIIDPAGVKAIHPATYPNRTSLQKARDELTYCLDAEGFHVIEHILLRPKENGEPANIRWNVSLGDSVALSLVKTTPILFGEKPSPEELAACKSEATGILERTLKSYELPAAENWMCCQDPVNLYDEAGQLTVLGEDRAMVAIAIWKRKATFETIPEQTKSQERFLTHWMICSGQKCLVKSLQPLETPEQPDGNTLQWGAIAFEREIAGLLNSPDKQCEIDQDGYLEIWKGNQPFARSVQRVGEACLDNFIDCLKLPVPELMAEIIPDLNKDELFMACVDPLDCSDQELPTDCIPGADPYSFWVTVAIPHWGRRFRNLDFRQFIEKTIRREAPAHIGLRIGWISPRQMMELESSYRAWLEANAYGDDSCARRHNLNALIRILNNLNNRYPSANLHDCDVPGVGGDSFVLLDQTIISE